jgi:hypothetical protein
VTETRRPVSPRRARAAEEAAGRAAAELATLTGTTTRAQQDAPALALVAGTSDPGTPPILTQAAAGPLKPVTSLASLSALARLNQLPRGRRARP